MTGGGAAGFARWLANMGAKIKAGGVVRLPLLLWDYDPGRSPSVT